MESDNPYQAPRSTRCNAEQAKSSSKTRSARFFVILGVVIGMGFGCSFAVIRCAIDGFSAFASMRDSTVGLAVGLAVGLVWSLAHRIRCYALPGGEDRSSSGTGSQHGEAGKQCR